jgi:hypothetical protein
MSSHLWNDLYSISSFLPTFLFSHLQTYDKQLWDIDTTLTTPYKDWRHEPDNSRKYTEQS